MSTTLLTTETMKFTDARQNLSQVVNRVARHETRVLVEKSGVPVAAIVSPDDLRRLNELEARRQEQSRQEESKRQEQARQELCHRERCSCDAGEAELALDFSHEVVRSDGDATGRDEHVVREATLDRVSVVVLVVRDDGRRLFAGLDNPFQATRYHSLVIQPDTLHPDFIVCAWSDGPDGSREIMGIRHRSQPVFGLQFLGTSDESGDGRARGLGVLGVALGNGHAFLANIAVSLIPIIQRGQKMTSLELKGQQTRQALEVAQSRIEDLERQKKDLLHQMEIVKADAQEGLVQAENLAALTRMQEETQNALERLKQENEELRALKTPKNGTATANSKQIEDELRLTLEEVARLQNQLAEANIRIVELLLPHASRPHDQEA